MAVDLSAYDDATAEIIDKNATIPTQYDALLFTGNDNQYETYTINNEDGALNVIFRYNGDMTNNDPTVNIYDYEDGMRLNQYDVGLTVSTGDIVEIKIEDFDTPGKYIVDVNAQRFSSIYGFGYSQETVEFITIAEPSIIENIFGVISAVVLGGIGIIGGLFTGESTIINVFWTPATETVSGSLTIIGVLSLFTFGFSLVVFAFRKILKIIRMRS